MKRPFPIAAPTCGWILVGLMLTLATWAHASATGVEITLSPSARIDADLIRLGQIAEVRADGSAPQRELSALVIDPAPLPGQDRRLDRKDLALRLRQAGLDPDRIRFSGADAVTVRRTAVTLGQGQIAQIASDWILAHQPFDPGQVRVAGVQTSDSILLPAGRLTYRVEPPRQIDFLRPVPLTIEFSVDAKPRKRVWATVSLSVMAPVVVSRKPLARYQTIAEESVAVEMRDMAGISGGVISDPAMVIGQRMRRSIGAGTVLRSDLVEVPPVVRRGDMVTIVAESGGLRVTALGKVRGKARPGERVGVVNTGSGKTIYARVLDAKTVQVEF